MAMQTVRVEEQGENISGCCVKATLQYSLSLQRDGTVCWNDDCWMGQEGETVSLYPHNLLRRLFLTFYIRP